LLEIPLCCVVHLPSAGLVTKGLQPDDSSSSLHKPLLGYTVAHAASDCSRVLAIMAGHICALPVWCDAQERHVLEQPAKSDMKVLTRVPPSYPQLARRMNVVGIVRVVAVVAPNGKIARTEAVGGSPLLAVAAVDAISKWKWIPASEETKEMIEIKFKPEH